MTAARQSPDHTAPRFTSGRGPALAPVPEKSRQALPKSLDRQRHDVAEHSTDGSNMPTMDPPKPTTAIPELVSMELRHEEYEAISAAEQAVRDLLVSRLQPRGASLRCRIELAAAILVGAIDHGHEAAVDTGAMEPDAVMQMVVDLVGRRAMEIWGQGGA